MEQISPGEMERTMKVQEVILRAMAKKITWWQAAEILGVSERTMRRLKLGYQRHSFKALFDGRKGKPNWRKAPAQEVEKVLGLNREQYYDLNVRHFHEKLEEKHDIHWSYTWLKNVLQGAGLVMDLMSSVDLTAPAYLCRFKRPRKNGGKEIGREKVGANFFPIRLPPQHAQRHDKAVA